MTGDFGATILSSTYTGMEMKMAKVSYVYDKPYDTKVKES